MMRRLVAGYRSEHKAGVLELQLRGPCAIYYRNTLVVEVSNLSAPADRNAFATHEQRVPYPRDVPGNHNCKCKAQETFTLLKLLHSCKQLIKCLWVVSLRDSPLPICG